MVAREFVKQMKQLPRSVRRRFSMEISGVYRKGFPIFILFFALICIVFPHNVLGSSEESGGGGVTVIPDGSIIIQIINFLLAIWLLNVLLYRPIELLQPQKTIHQSLAKVKPTNPKQNQMQGARPLHPIQTTSRRPPQVIVSSGCSSFHIATNSSLVLPIFLALTMWLRKALS